MAQDMPHQPSDRGGREEADPAPRLIADELDVARGHLRRLLECHVEAIQDLERITGKLSIISQTPGAADFPDESSEVSDLLTAQQARVLEQLCLGRTNRQVARTLGITEKTAKNYTQAIFRKLGVHSRTEAALFAIRHRWFDTGEMTTDAPEGRIPQPRDGDTHTSGEAPARKG